MAVTAAAVLWALERGTRRPLVGRALAGAAAVLVAASPLLHGTVVTGLGQRLLWAVVLSWLVVAGTEEEQASTPDVKSPKISEQPVEYR